MSRLAVLIAAVCFGTTGTAQALGPAASPVAVGAVRVILGSLLLLLAAAATRRLATTSRQKRILLGGGAAVAAYQLTFFAAVEDTGVAIGTVVAIGSAPAFAGVFDRLARGARLTARWVLATSLAVTGVLMLVLGGGGATVSAFGVVLALGSGLGYASYLVCSKVLLEDGHRPEWVMAWMFGLGGLFLVPVAPVAGLGWLLSAEGVALALFLAAVPTALAYVLFARGLRRIDSGEAATLTLAEPLTAAALGVVVLGERPSALAVVGAALVLAGLVALALPARRVTSGPQPGYEAAPVAT